MTHRLCYVMCPSRACARELATAVVGERLAACANIQGPVELLYWWDGRLQQGEEFVLLLKTSAGLVEALAERVRELHPYTCPCVIALPIDGGNPAYLDWIERETTPLPKNQL